MNLLIFGAPGSGKGTQSEMISKKLNLLHLSTGQIFRDYFKINEYFEGYTKEQYDKGILANDEVATNLVAKILPKENFILDGFPRTLYQAEKLKEILEIDYAIHLECPFPILKERILKRGRSDDKEEIIKSRFEIYLNQTKPLIKYYGKKVLTINGDDDKFKVHWDILQKLK